MRYDEPRRIICLLEISDDEDDDVESGVVVASDVYDERRSASLLDISDEDGDESARTL